MTQIGPKVFSPQLQQQAAQQAVPRFNGASRDGSSPTDEFKGKRRTKDGDSSPSASKKEGSFFPSNMPVAMRQALEQVDRLLHS